MTRQTKNLPNKPRYELLNTEAVKDFACVRILDGDFMGLVYHYNTISLGEDDGGPEIPFKFTYDIVDGWDEAWTEPSLTELLQDTLCSILFDLIENQDNVARK